MCQAERAGPRLRGRQQIRSIQAAILHLPGLDHTKLTCRFRGRDFRLTDVAGEVVRDILA